MPRFIIERDIPGAGDLTPEQLGAISRRSCQVLQDMGPSIQWQESFVTDGKIYCVYIAPDEATVLDHARRGEFPADSINVVRAMIDPTTAEHAPAP